MEDLIYSRWERREAKELAKRRCVSDNRNSVRLLNSLSTSGKPKKIKRVKHKFRQNEFIMSKLSKEPYRHFLMDEVTRLIEKIAQVTHENNLLRTQLEEITQGIDILTPISANPPKPLSKQGAVRPLPMVQVTEALERGSTGVLERLSFENSPKNCPISPKRLDFP